jgi:hypothetical protein
MMVGSQDEGVESGGRWDKGRTEEPIRAGVEKGQG